MCGSSTVKNVRCSQNTVSCGKPCGKLLACGYHKCRKMCHLPGECEDCTQTCGKPKSLCGHPCQKKCHAPSKCSQDEPCAELVEATCPCGNIKQRARCGACTASPTSNGGQKLSCTPACAVAQRNAALADAFGISKDRQAGSSQNASWLPETLTFYGENTTWAKHIEQTFTEFMNSSRATHLFSPMKYPQRKFIHEIAQKFKLRSESLDEEPFRSVMLSKKQDSCTPKPTLSEAWLEKYKQSGTTAPTLLPAKRTLLTQQPQKSATAVAQASVPSPARQDVNCLYLEACFGYDAQTLQDTIRPSMSGLDFQLLWVNDEDVVCLVKAPQLSSSDLTLKLRLLRTTLRHKISNCRAIDTAYYDSSSSSVTYREQSWTSVSGTRTPAPSSASYTSTPALDASNAFSKLSLGGERGNGTRTPASASMSASSSTAGRGGSDNVISSGLYRPPRAVVVNPKQQDPDESVADNWEDVA
jgi:transcriptional repressor NF-X1